MVAKNLYTPFGITILDPEMAGKTQVVVPGEDVIVLISKNGTKNWVFSRHPEYPREPEVENG
jgi:hypothetical protein